MHTRLRVHRILPYTERHFQRIDKLAEASYVIEYTLPDITQIEMEAETSLSPC